MNGLFNIEYSSIYFQYLIDIGVCMYQHSLERKDPLICAESNIYFEYKHKCNV